MKVLKKVIDFIYGLKFKATLKEAMQTSQQLSNTGFIPYYGIFAKTSRICPVILSDLSQLSSRGHWSVIYKSGSQLAS